MIVAVIGGIAAAACCCLAWAALGVGCFAATWVLCNRACCCPSVASGVPAGPCAACFAIGCCCVAWGARCIADSCLMLSICGPACFAGCCCWIVALGGSAGTCAGCCCWMLAVVGGISAAACCWRTVLGVGCFAATWVLCTRACCCPSVARGVPGAAGGLAGTCGACMAVLSVGCPAWGGCCCGGGIEVSGCGGTCAACICCCGGGVKVLGVGSMGCPAGNCAASCCFCCGGRAKVSVVGCPAGTCAACGCCCGGGVEVSGVGGVGCSAASPDSWDGTSIVWNKGWDDGCSAASASAGGGWDSASRDSACVPASSLSSRFICPSSEVTPKLSCRCVDGKTAWQAAS